MTTLPGDEHDTTTDAEWAIAAYERRTKTPLSEEGKAIVRREWPYLRPDFPHIKIVGEGEGNEQGTEAQE